MPDLLHFEQALIGRGILDASFAVRLVVAFVLGSKHRVVVPALELAGVALGVAAALLPIAKNIVEVFLMVGRKRRERRLGNCRHRGGTGHSRSVSLLKQLETADVA